MSAILTATNCTKLQVDVKSNLCIHCDDQISKLVTDVATQDDGVLFQSYISQYLAKTLSIDPLSSKIFPECCGEFQSILYSVKHAHTGFAYQVKLYTDLHVYHDFMLLNRYTDYSNSLRQLLSRGM